MYLKKIDLHIPNIDYNRLKGEFFEGYGDTFRQYHIKDTEYLEKIILNKIEFGIKPDWVLCCEVSDLGVGPHSDQSSVSLNYYIDPAGCITTFWEPKPDVIGLVAPQLQKDGSQKPNDVRAYKIEELIPKQSFMAKQGEAYLLNIKKVHSATRFSNNGSVRKILRWMWDSVDFETIKDHIKIIN